MIDIESAISNSSARAEIKRRIEEIPEMVKNFDPSPWMDSNVIRPLPGKQEEFLTTKAQIAFYGGSAG